ncbi:hypothetical protein Pelo_19318 [Pelomyxa schiedti]|nr:hypothetical protein Pelo_19318 [Pelomyxa schiedti]
MCSTQPCPFSFTLWLTVLVAAAIGSYYETHVVVSFGLSLTLGAVTHAKVTQIHNNELIGWVGDIWGHTGMLWCRTGPQTVFFQTWLTFDFSPELTTKTTQVKIGRSMFPLAMFSMLRALSLVSSRSQVKVPPRSGTLDILKRDASVCTEGVLCHIHR